MAGTKEIRVKIASVKSTQKITKAMQMVATSKMRQAQDRMRLARPYADKIRSVIGNLTQANPDYRHPFLQERAEVKNVGVIVISPDRGLCGSLNVNNFKNAADGDARLAGQRARRCRCASSAARRPRSSAACRIPILANTSGLGDQPHIKDLIGTVKVMLDAYKEGKIDRLFLVHREFVNTMTQKPRAAAAAAGGARRGRRAAGALGLHLRARRRGHPRWRCSCATSKSQVYRGAVENVACEMAARMVAMKAASDNAGKLISELQLVYNKARQAAITKELAEIVGGAAAV